MPIVRLPQGSLRDEIRQPIYDTRVLEATFSPVGDYEYFSNVQGKSKALTNLRQNNLLETAVSFRIQGMCVDAQNYYAENAGVLPVTMENSSIELRVGEKIYWEGPMVFLSGRMTQHSDSAAAPALYQRFGDQAVAPIIFSGKHVVDINPLQSFRVKQTCDQMVASKLALATPAADTDVRFITSLKGLLRRPVQ